MLEKIIKVALKETDKWIFKVILLLLSLQTVLLLESAPMGKKERKKERKKKNYLKSFLEILVVNWVIGSQFWTLYRITPLFSLIQ